MSSPPFLKIKNPFSSLLKRRKRVSRYHFPSCSRMHFAEYLPFDAYPSLLTASTRSAPTLAFSQTAPRRVRLTASIGSHLPPTLCIPPVKLLFRFIAFFDYLLEYNTFTAFCKAFFPISSSEYNSHPIFAIALLFIRRFVADYAAIGKTFESTRSIF